jgi:glycosyltransferase involved in cell wall biosynthesis
LRRQLAAAGVSCLALEVGGRGGRGRLLGGLSRLACVERHARAGWVVHVHANGHNARSWLLALGCAAAGRTAPARVLTLHSGLAPEYLAGATAAERLLVRFALRSYERVLCVNERIRNAVAALGVPAAKLEVAPAWLPEASAPRALPDLLERWLDRGRPLLSAALFFRPEYGLTVLLDALARLKPAYPGLACVVLGGGEQEAAARREVAARGMADWVLLTGDLPHELCLTLMARSDLFVRPTLADGDALSVREALALGVPVVASDAAPRPPGTRLFRRGDAVELAERAAAALAGAPPAPVRAAPAGDGDPLAKLLSTYREAADEEGEWPLRSWAS